MNGKLLAQARQEKERQYNAAVAENERRHTLAYARVPRLREIDSAMADLIGQVVKGTLEKEPRDMAWLQERSLELQAERAELLTEHGWPVDWLDGAWYCPICRDSGHVEGRICSCVMEIYEKKKAADLSVVLPLGDATFENFDLSLYSDAVDPALGASPREVMKLAWESCRDYAAKFGPGSRNFLFQGNTGLGKTHLSSCIAREVLAAGHSVVYDTVTSALGAFEARQFARSSREAEEAEGRVRRLLESELVIVDDLGTEMLTEMTKSALYTLINSRLLSGGKTIISTNLTRSELARRYTAPIMSRLEGEYDMVMFAGSDIRQIRRQRRLR